LGDQRCLQVLADQTLNDEKAVTAQNVTTLLDIMKKSTASEVREEYEQKLAETRRQVQELQEQVAQLKEREQEISTPKPRKDSQPHDEIIGILKQLKRDFMGSTSLVRSTYSKMDQGGRLKVI
jgi:ferritin-like metal-binding protein YciE